MLGDDLLVQPRRLGEFVVARDTLERAAQLVETVCADNAAAGLQAMCREPYVFRDRVF